MALWALPVAASQGKESAKVDSALAGSLASGIQKHRVIVTVETDHRAEVAEHVKSHGGRVKAEFPPLGLVVGELSTDEVRELAKDSHVKTLSLDGPVGAHQLLTSLLTSLTPTLTTTVRETLGVNGSSPTGSGIGVALIDSGIAPNSDFNGRIGGFYDFTNGRGGAAVAAYDDYGHSTHIAGLIASKGVLSNG